MSLISLQTWDIQLIILWVCDNDWADCAWKDWIPFWMEDLFGLNVVDLVAPCPRKVHSWPIYKGISVLLRHWLWANALSICSNTIAGDPPSSDPTFTTHWALGPDHFFITFDNCSFEASFLEALLLSAGFRPCELAAQPLPPYLEGPAWVRAALLAASSSSQAECPIGRLAAAEDLDFLVGFDDNVTIEGCSDRGDTEAARGLPDRRPRTETHVALLWVQTDCTRVSFTPADIQFWPSWSAGSR